MEEEFEILDVTIELGNGSIHKMFIQEIEEHNWINIDLGTNALLNLYNGQQMYVQIVNANCEGISFKIVEDTHTYFYDTEIIESLYVEVNKK